MLVEKEICTGCGSCVVSCPRKCISMREDKEGFRVPMIDSAYCVNCQKCEKSCPVLQRHIKFKVYAGFTKAFAAKNKDNYVRYNSSSGGFFSALAEMIIAKNGIVYAAKYDEHFGVKHDAILSDVQISDFCGAKYVQSKVEHCYPQIEEQLKKEKIVLFVGTPCQVAGLVAYLHCEYSNLILVDMICHGVPSPKVWFSYLKERKKIDASKEEIKSINLRNKSTGWSNYTYSVEIKYKNGNLYSVKQDEDWFMRGFVNNLFLRASCSKCVFKGRTRYSDLTLGDYWGIWNQYPEFDDNKGVSLILIHSEKGYEYWNQIKEQFETMEVDVDLALAENPSALKNSIPHPKRSEFFERLKCEKSVIALIKSCLNITGSVQASILERIINRLRYR